MAEFSSAREKNCSFRKAAVIHVDILPTEPSTFGLSLLSVISDNKEKPSVEGTVGKIATAIIARCRNDVYHSFSELKKGVADSSISSTMRLFRNAKAAVMRCFRKKGNSFVLSRMSLTRSPSGSMAGL